MVFTMIQRLIKSRYFFDILLILAILVISLVIILINLDNKEKSVIASVYYKDELITEIDLSKETSEREFEIYLDSSEFIRVRVKKNAIKVVYANCRNHDCVRSGWTSSTNKPIICLDLGYKILIKGKDEIDAVVK